MLTRAIAEQVGGAHEDPEIEEGLAAMHQIQIGGDYSHIAALVAFSNTVLAAGAAFFRFLIENHGYKPERLKIERG